MTQANIIKADCPCKRIKCENHGNCESCKAHHAALKRASLTACEKLTKKTEKQAQRAEKRAQRRKK